MLTYGCLLGALLVSSPLAARHTLRSGAAVGDSRVFRLRDSVVVEMRIDLAGMEVRSDRSVVLIPSLCDGERTIALPAVEVMGRRRALYYERNGSRTYARQPYRVVRKDPEGGADGGLPRGAAPCGMDGSSSAGNDGRPLRMRQDRSRTLGFPVRGGR